MKTISVQKYTTKLRTQGLDPVVDTVNRVITVNGITVATNVDGDCANLVSIGKIMHVSPIIAASSGIASM